MEMILSFYILLIIVMVSFLVASSVVKVYFKSLCEESGLSEVICEGFARIYDGLEYFSVGLEHYKRSVVVRISHNRKGRHNLSPFVSLGIHLSVNGNLYLQPFAEGVYNRCAYAVESSGNLVAASSEFTSGMEYCENDFYRRYPFLMVYTDRYSSSVILYGNNVARKYFHIYLRTIAFQRLVNGIVHYFVNKMMKSL